MLFEMAPHERSGILQLAGEREFIRLRPTLSHDRSGWPAAQRRAFIESILAGIDLPKLYFREACPPWVTQAERGRVHEVLDGSRRLDAIFAFMSGQLRLAQDFRPLMEPDREVGACSYDELLHRHPHLRARFDGTKLPIVVVRTSDEELLARVLERLGIPPSRAHPRRRYRPDPQGPVAFTARMERAAWSVTRIARLLEVSRTTIQRWSRGATRIPNHVWLALDEVEYAGAGTAIIVAYDLQSHMRRTGWDDGHLADALGASPNMIRYWRSAGRIMPAHMRLAIAAAERAGARRGNEPPEA